MSKKLIYIVCILISFSFASPILAQTVVNINASTIVAHSQVSITPPTGTFVEGSTFQVPILLNTEGLNVNAIELHINFDPNILSVVDPTGGKSIVGVWVQPPSFDNTLGTVDISGVIPTGIVSDSSVVMTITFEAKAAGESDVSVDENTSHVLLNDGVGSPTILETSKATYTIIPKPPAGVVVTSDTHPFQDTWYNNNSPSLSWTEDAGVTGFSYVLDTQPNTIPDNIVNATGTAVAFENVPDGVNYFHIKAYKNGAWGPTTDYTLRIDTVPPAAFTPTVNSLGASVIGRSLISFFTTDALSGLSHYEVGVVDTASPVTTNPIFTEVSSPYQLPMVTSPSHVIIRAFDMAGNVREESIDVNPPPLAFLGFLDTNENIILLITLILIIIFIILHFTFSHHIVKRFRKAAHYFREEGFEEKTKETTVRTMSQDELLPHLSPTPEPLEKIVQN